MAGYFDPDYGDIFPKENAVDIVSQMLKIMIKFQEDLS